MDSGHHSCNIYEPLLNHFPHCHNSKFFFYSFIFDTVCSCYPSHSVLLLHFPSCNSAPMLVQWYPAFTTKKKNREVNCLDNMNLHIISNLSFLDNSIAQVIIYTHCFFNPVWELLDFFIVSADYSLKVSVFACWLLIFVPFQLIIKSSSSRPIFNTLLLLTLSFIPFLPSSASKTASVSFHRNLVWGWY